jgi:hypothetical protein
VNTVNAPDRPVPGTWIGASRVLGRPVFVYEPYPHLHNYQLPSGNLIERRQCGACPQVVRR